MNDLEGWEFVEASGSNQYSLLALENFRSLPPTLRRQLEKANSGARKHLLTEEQCIQFLNKVGKEFRLFVERFPKAVAKYGHLELPSRGRRTPDRSAGKGTAMWGRITHSMVNLRITRGNIGITRNKCVYFTVDEKTQKLARKYRPDLADHERIWLIDD